MPRYIAVFTESDNAPKEDVAHACRAIQKQISRDLNPEWGTEAYVAFSETSEPAPGWERVGIYDELSYPDVNGFHLVQNDQPMACVLGTDFWTIDLSHEILEMIVDPAGRDFIPGYSLLSDQGRVNYLTEITDPCQDFDDSYWVDGVRVANFCTRKYFAPGAIGGGPYSMPNASGNPVLTRPHDISPGGYLTWFDDKTDKWWRADRFGWEIKFEEINPPRVYFSSLRASIDALSAPFLAERRDALRKKRGGLSKDDFFDPRVRAAAIARCASLEEAMRGLSEGAKKWCSCPQATEIRSRAAKIKYRFAVETERPSKHELGPPTMPRDRKAVPAVSPKTKAKSRAGTTGRKNRLHR